MKYQGNLVKMKSGLQNKEAVYSLQLDDKIIELKSILNHKVKIVFQNQINCVLCGKETRKSFGQGHCYSCFTTAPEADECILHPDKCKAHLGVARSMKWAEEHCLKPHIVYLANSGGLKVGVTRLSQVPVRWIDQGATQAIKICEAPSRHIAGVIESFLMKYFRDKTNWRRMVTNEVTPDFDLLREKKKAINLLSPELQRYILFDDDLIYKINYPVLEWPDKPLQVNFDKSPVVEAILKGVRGQYLIFNNQQVLNIRRFSGYRIEIIIDDV